MKYLFIILITLCFIEIAQSSKGSSSKSSGFKSIFKGKSKSSSSSSSSSSEVSLFGTTTTTTTTTTRRTTTASVSDQGYYESIRRTYCQAGSKISLGEIESAVTCPGQGFTLKLFSTLASENNKTNESIHLNSTLQNNETSTTTVSSITITTMTPVVEPQKNTTNPIEKICQNFNSTCFENMHTFVNECLSQNNSPISESYQFDLFLANEICVENKTTQFDEWTNGLENCTAPFFTSEILRKTVSACVKRHQSSIFSSVTSPSLESGVMQNVTHGYTNKILSCVRDKINAPSCTNGCKWGMVGCTPLTTLMRNYYVETAVNLLLFNNRS